jgi:hypothetical protein
VHGPMTKTLIFTKLWMCNNPSIKIMLGALHVSEDVQFAYLTVQSGALSNLD